MHKSIEERVGVITVSYLSAHVLPDLLNSLPNSIECIIVDNAPPEKKLIIASLGTRSTKVTVETPPGEKGFGAACNWGANLMKKEFIFFLNPDTRVTEGCMQELLAAMDSNPNASAANPKILNPNGRLEFKYRSALLPKPQWRGRTPPDELSEMPVLTGAALLVRKDAFENVGGFDENIFLYHEDDDLSIRLREEQGPLLYVPNAAVHHSPGSSSNRSPSIALRKAFFLSKSRTYAQTKHGIPWAKTKTLALAIIGIINPLSFLSFRKLAKSWGYLLGALSPYK